MNTDRLLTAGIALCCVFALGTSASTLGSSVATDPDEVVDLDYRSLPIDPSEAGELKEEAQSKDTQRSSSADGKERERSSRSQQRSDSGGQQRGGEDDGGSMTPPDFLDRLLELLRRLLQYLLWLVPLVAVAGGVALGVRFRDRLFGADGRSDPGVTRSVPPPDPDPSNEIERAWWEMVERFDVEDARTRTPGECATAAREAGGDPGAVDELTRTFEAVRYGDAPLTDDRVERARRSVDSLRRPGR